MRFLSFLILGMGCHAVSAQQAPPGAIPVPSRAVGARSIVELRDAWPGIADATNQWAQALRSQPEWAEVAGATIEQTKSLAEKGVPLAQLKLGYSYFAGDGVDRDYAAAVRWLHPASDAHLVPAEFLLGIAYLNG